MSIKEHPPLHVPVLLNAVLAQLAPQPGESYLDLTAGYGGHARAILAQTENYTASVLVDRDVSAIDTLGDLKQQGVNLIHDDFVSAAHALIAESRQFDLILLDLGVSSPQLDRAERGFSFTNDGPLDMRMDDRQTTKATDVVNFWSVEKLADMIQRYGEEPRGAAWRYARAIVAGRPFATTGELAETIKQAHVGKWQKTHPATRTFQAIRIQVNQELEQVQQILQLLPQMLNTGGRVGVISFHSLEDRLVKQYFAQQAQAGYESEFTISTKKPIDGSIEDVHNPRSRSAKLRVAVKK